MHIRQSTTVGPMKTKSRRQTARLVVESDKQLHLDDLSLDVRGQRLPLVGMGAVRDVVFVSALRGPERKGAGRSRCIPPRQVYAVDVRKHGGSLRHGKFHLLPTGNDPNHGINHYYTCNVAHTNRGSPHTKWRLAIGFGSNQFPFSANGKAKKRAKSRPPPRFARTSSLILSSPRCLQRTAPPEAKASGVGSKSGETPLCKKRRKVTSSRGRMV